MKKYFGFALVFFIMMVCGFGAVVTAEAEEVGDLNLGNSPEIIMNGGNIVSDETGDTYIIDTTDGMLYHYENGSPALFSEDKASYLNLIDDELFYVILQDQTYVVKRRNLNTGDCDDVYQTSDKIEHMLVSGQGQIFYLSDGEIYCYDLTEQELELGYPDTGISSFIPVNAGYIYNKGRVPDSDLYYNGSLVMEEVSSYYLSGEYLILVSNGKTYQADLDDLQHEEKPVNAVVAYNEKTFSGPSVLHMDNDEGCSYCEEHLDEVTFSLNTVASLSSGATSGIEQATERQKNIVKRARQMTEVYWTPLKDIVGWDSSYIFKKDVTYMGLPYGQPVDGVFVPWGTTLSGFVAAVNNVQSKMYTDYAEYSARAPYYSCDCSSFVSWAWNLSGRRTTQGLPTYGDKIASQSIYNAQIGDSFVYPGNHAVLVSDIGYDAGGNIVYIDIAESTPPKTKVTRYGAGGSSSLTDLQYRYLQNGYTMYRLKSQYTVSYTHDCAVPIDDWCDKCGMPETPVITGIEQTGSGSMMLSWNRVEGADAYGILRSETQNGTYDYIAAAWEDSYTDYGLDSRKTYYYKVFAMRYTGSEWISGLPSGIVKSDFLKAPDKLQVAPAGDQNLKLSWSAVDGADVYGIARSETSNGPFEWLEAVGVTEFVDSGREPGKVYYYRVYASRYTDRGWMNGPDSDVKAGIAELPAVQNVRTGPGSGVHSVKISWDSVKNASIYGIMRSERIDGSYQWINAVDGTSYTDENLQPGKTYYYKIYSSIYFENEWHNGGISEGVAGSMIAAPENVQVVSSQGEALKLTWDAVSGASQYVIYCSDTWNGALERIAVVDKNEYVHNGLNVNDKKYYVIQTMCIVDGAGGIGDHTGYVEGKVTAPAPTILSAGPGAGPHAVKIAWSAVNGADVYGIMRSDSENGPYEWINAVNALSYTDMNLSVNKEYYYKVYAAKLSGGVWMNGESSQPAKVMVCPAPDEVSVQSSGDSLKVKWSKVQGAWGYSIYRDDGAGLVLIASTQQLEYNDTGLEFGRTYSYVIQSMVLVDGQYGLGDNTIPVAGELKVGVPSNISATANADSQTVDLAWSAVPGVQLYGIMRAESPEGPYTWLSATSDTNYRDTDCRPEEEYYYQIYGAIMLSNGWLNGEISEVISVSVPKASRALGVDVSRYNGDVDWYKVSETQVEFAMVRIGYRRNADGVIIEDPYAAQNIQGALNAGLDVGVYFFSTAVNEAEAQEEAEWVINYIKSYNITYPVAFDCEGYDEKTSRMYGLTAGQRTNHAVVFLDAVAGQGYTPLMYGSKYHLVNSWDIAQLEQRCQVWVAQWPSTVPVYPAIGETTYSRPYAMWQYTDRGSVDGITGNVDMDVYYY
ncbi:hypothetical protein LQE92_05790 [Lacrimispora sp. NSJ-141]|uniref:Fibronectin type-III domain-containing protein n=1 Tax=Lientehia hominis TaxID=2897778 RepID=A0AAP2RIR3_9FIRM|nr:GH25 family lysozyme [Lientehia hominis]MCD2492138.1 hypothetical protein [Lientehia hominis]